MFILSPVVCVLSHSSFTEKIYANAPKKSSKASSKKSTKKVQKTD